ncbi:MAG TPA: amidohydrolase family protein [Bacteroidales bacterium]|nr:amidohydrolase family protein [Bacteroidales bacterium]
MYRKRLLICLMFLPALVWSQTGTEPVTGVSDKRPEIYGFKNARLYADYQTVMENTDFLVSGGRITAVGKNLSFPRGTIVTDLTGKTVYPSFIDAYAANYGIRTQQQTGGSAGQQSYVVAVSQQGSRQASSLPEAEPRIAGYWNEGIKASFNFTDEFIPDSRTAAEYRQAGFGAVVAFKSDGLARGTSSLVTTGDGNTNNLILKSRATANYSFTRGRSSDTYPASLFGIIALLRQFNYDAQWYKQLPPGYFHDDDIEAYLSNLSLPQVMEVRNKLEIMRADRIAKEFGIKYIIKGAGDEYQALNEIKKAGVMLITPVSFPEAPDVKDPLDAARIPFENLKQYELAPSNLSMISAAGIPFAITSSDLRQRSSFLANLRKAVRYGLPETEALKNLTYTPASMVGATQLVGALKKDMLANFIITSGNIFSDDCIIFEHWVQGVPYRFVDLRLKDVRGTYTLTVDTARYRMTVSGALEKPSVRLFADTVEIRGASFTVDKDLVTLSFERQRTRFRLPGYISGSNLEGRGQTDSGKWIAWKAEFQSRETGPDTRPARPQAGIVKPGPVVYPFKPYGWTSLPVQENVLFRNATVWTCEKDGILQNADVLVVNGKIAAVGRNLKAGDAKIIDATGLHLTPGLIDEHSHIALDATNEMGQAITSEVRCLDVVDPEDISIYRQLAGGVTAAHILHGSANPVGGQSVIIKHRWGKPAGELVIDGQPGFLKHALGENVKRTTSRYPNTRMGTEQIIRDAYQRAVDYNREWQAWNKLKPAEKAGKVPPRRDLELDALVDVLEGRSFIACHTYVQSEGTMIMNLAQDFGIKVNTLIHFNEGYKIADQIKEHGAAASVFSDWWDYKYEVYEGTSYNASMLLSQGVLTCLHSDDAEMGRRLNQEAAKIVKYGNVSEEEALKLVTINPARILHLDNRMGSIKPGKDADLVLWSGNPLSVYSRALKTMIDGTFYFDEENNEKMKDFITAERNRITGNILRESQQSGNAITTNFSRR